MEKAVHECGSDGKPTHRDAALPNTEPRSLDCRAVPPRKPADRPTILDSHPHPPLPSHPSHTYTLPYPGVSHPPASPTPQRQRGSPSSLWTAMFAHRLRFNSPPLILAPIFFLKLSRSSPFLLFFMRCCSFSPKLLLSLFVLLLSYCISILAANNHRIRPFLARNSLAILTRNSVRVPSFSRLNIAIHFSCFSFSIILFVTTRPFITSFRNN